MYNSIRKNKKDLTLDILSENDKKFGGKNIDEMEFEEEAYNAINYTNQSPTNLDTVGSEEAQGF